MDDASHSSRAVEIRNGAPGDDAIETAGRARANRLFRQSAAVVPLNLLGAVWLFHDESLTAVLLWALTSAVVVGAGAWVLGWPIERERVLDGRVASATVQTMAIGAWALCWGLLPLVVSATSSSDVTPMIALLFPVGSAGLGALMSAPVERYFTASVVGNVVPPLYWLLFHETDYRRLAMVGVIYVASLWVCHRAVSAAVVQSMTLDRRTAELMAELDADREAIAATNRLVEDANQRLGQQAGHDPLTGLLNRRGLLEELDSALHEVEQRGGNVAVLIIDVDRFKVVNDSLGHAAGDQLLALIAARLSEICPPPISLGRLGGDEFVVVRRLPDGDPEPAVIELADLVRSSFEVPFQVDEQEIAVTSSIGVVHGPRQGPAGRDLLRHADAALHRAKAEGKDRYELFDDRLRNALARQVDEEQALRMALERGEIVPWYQPIVDAGTRRIVGAELLARWLPPDGPAVRAGSFISMMHESGLIEQFSEQVIEAGVVDLERWIEQGLPDGFRLSVNLPPRYVSRSGRVERLTEMLRNAPCERLTAEVTETSVVDDLDLAARRLAELRSFGMTVVLDDFGTGSASLTLLQRVPLDGVKIDRSFVKNIAVDARDRALVGGFIQLASTIDLEVTAEGIENPAQVKALLALGCPRQQGYLHGTAMTADELYIALPMRPKRGARSGA